MAASMFGEVDTSNVSVAAFQCPKCTISTTGNPLKWHRDDQGCPWCGGELVVAEE